MASRSKRLRVLREVYDHVPQVHCKGLCWRACAAIPVSQLELETMERAAGRGLTRIDSGSDVAHAVLGEVDLRCPALLMRRCSIYEARPLICRLFGVAEGLECPHGCVPDRVLTHDEVQALMARAAKLA